MTQQSAGSLRAVGRQIRDYLSYVAGNFRLFRVVVALTAVVLILEYIATSLMIPMAPGQSADSSAVGRFWSHVAGLIGLDANSRTWMWLFFIVMTLRLVIGFVHLSLTTLLGKQVHRTLSGKVFGHILFDEPMGQVYTRSVGHYITMAGDDTFKSGSIISNLLQTAVGFFTAAVGMLVLFQFSHMVFLGVLGFLIVSMLTIGLMMKQILRVNARAIVLSRELGTNFVETLNSLRSIRALHEERFVMTSYGEQIARYVRMLVEVEVFKYGVKAFPAIVLLLGAAIALRPGSSVGMTDAGLFAGTIIVIRIFASLGQMVTAGAQLLTDVRAVKDIGALVRLGDDEPGAKATGKATGKVAGQPTAQAAKQAIRTLTFDRVSFGYAGRERVLADVSFEFSAGRTYAIVGPSGSGKSTFADIAIGLSDPDTGTILVNGKAGSHEAGPRNIMLVEQQPKIFSTNVRDNLLVGTQASDSEIFATLALVNLEQMVRDLPEGLDTRLSYLGENFSGGQRQRLGIARALLRKPDVLILDEATSALDPVTRGDVVSNIRRLMRDGIIIFITHDMDIANLADEILPIGAHEPACDVVQN
ncbi:ATP-binding cassette domain-containing protein [Pandoraea sp. NPDC087047]|uniref:ATP-binding cassette domain-containing protein n=1 Tax=Pandoraea sp. NPDC087047 TaxID=3364390 RepID=UPI0037FA7A08